MKFKFLIRKTQASFVVVESEKSDSLLLLVTAMQWLASSKSCHLQTQTNGG